MFFLRRPSSRRIAELLDAASLNPFTYSEIGASRERAPRGYPLNHHRDPIGRGELEFHRSVRALRRWAMYELPWTWLCWPGRPIEPGVTVGVLVRHFGFWSLNPCRIVYAIDETTARGERVGFGFGTLPGHAEQGEERFSVEWRPDDSVWFEIYTFARAHHPLVRAAAPLLRPVQFRFGRAAVAAMRRAVRSPEPAGENLVTRDMP